MTQPDDSTTQEVVQPIHWVLDLGSVIHVIEPEPELEKDPEST